MSKFNYTNRQDIHKHDVDIRIIGQDENAIFSFLPHFEKYNFPWNAQVVVEAYRNAQWKRFLYGSIASPKIPDDTSLAYFGGADGVLFRVKVITNSSDKKLLGLLKSIRPKAPDDDDDGRISILAVQATDDIGHLVWDIDFSDDEPLLKINKNLAGVQLANTPQFIGLVFPIIIKAAFINALLVNRDPHPNWCDTWLKFARSLGVEERPGDDDLDYVEKTEHWIDNVCRAFAMVHALSKLPVDWEE